MKLFAQFCVVLGILLVLQSKGNSCSDTGNVNGRYNNELWFYSASGAAYIGAMTTLYHAWYRYDDSGKFTFFDDSREWRGMDKLGHFTTTWWAGQWLYTTATLAGLPEHQKLIASAGIPMLFMTTIEVFDGFSKGYGFSAADMLANTGGAALFYLQQRYLAKQDILFKASFHNDYLYKLRPQLLGTKWPETWLKNYNGQTIWMSIPLRMFGLSADFVPPWISLSVGYGAGGMLGARQNTWMEEGKLVTVPEVERFSRYFLSFDLDLQKIPIKGKAWQIFSSTFRWLKIPFPTIEYQGVRNWKVHPFYW